MLLVSEDEELPTCAIVSHQLLAWDEDASRFLAPSSISGLVRCLLRFSQSASAAGGERDGRSVRSAACPTGRPPFPPPGPHPSLLRQSFGCKYPENRGAVGSGLSDVTLELADL